MKKSFSRSLLMWPLLATCLTLSAFGQRPTLTYNDAAGRAPVLTQQVESRAPLFTGTTFNFWDSLASTDYYNVVPSVLQAPNPDIATGPDDILVVVNRVIARYPNPNAAGNAQVTNPWSKGPGATPAYIGNPPTSKVFLDVWLGEANLAKGCPTIPRTNTSCVIDNASVRYDQMQGRFLVVFTIVDTVARKASWALIVSKYATFALGNPNTTEVFTTPNPPGPSQDGPNSGGVNSNWTAFLGTDTDINNVATTYGGGSSLTPQSTPPLATTAVVNPRDCAIRNAGPTQTFTTGSWCYFPTGVRVGIDNDNIIISSPVINDNIASDVNGVRVAAAFAGTRLRVYKKNNLYYSGTPEFAASPLTAGDPLIDKQGAYYDLFPVPAPTVVSGQITYSGTPSPFFSLVTPFTLDPNQVTGQIGANGKPVQPGPTAIKSNLFYEPEHVRGRSLASYSGDANLGPCRGLANLAFNNQYPCLNNNQGQVPTIVGPNTADASATGQTGLTTLVGAVSTLTTDVPQTVLYFRNIWYSRSFGGTANSPSTNPPTPVTGFAIAGGIPYLQESWEVATVPPFTNPATVKQRGLDPNGATAVPNLFVGDNRPLTVISREGHKYIARTGNQTSTSAYLFNGDPLSSTVIYDLVQKLGPTTVPLPIINTKWNNGRFFAPMFDVPANVIQYGSISPINLIPYLDKVFVATTFAPLAPTDARWGTPNGVPPYLTDTQKAVCRGQEPGVPVSTQPSVTNNDAYVGLFDIRCGEDSYDTRVPYVDPTTGSVIPSASANSPALWSSRGGAGIDPNNGTLWVYGAYAGGRQSSILGAGQWGTHVANYDMYFPTQDLYGNATNGYPDVTPSHQFYRYIQIAKQTDIAPGGRTATGNFNPSALVTRGEMAAWVIKAQMDDVAVNAYLAATGGTFTSFQDVPTTDPNFKYIETMYRRGYTKGCAATIDAVRRFCPAENLSRGQMAVFIIRAKMNSVFPTVVSGAYAGSFGGDLFGLPAAATGYFTDIDTDTPATATTQANFKEFAPYIRKLRELRITNGKNLTTTFVPGDLLTRGEIAAFIVRAFFF